MDFGTNNITTMHPFSLLLCSCFTEIDHRQTGFELQASIYTATTSATSTTAPPLFLSPFSTTVYWKLVRSSRASSFWCCSDDCRWSNSVIPFSPFLFYSYLFFSLIYQLDMVRFSWNIVALTSLRHKPLKWCHLHHCFIFFQIRFVIFIHISMSLVYIY